MARRGEHQPVSAHSEAGAIDSLSPEHLAALANAPTAREAVQAMKKALGGQRFRPSQSEPSSIPHVAVNRTSAFGAPIECEPVSQRSMRVLPEPAVPGAQWQPIASVELWRALGPDLDWIDLIVAARIGGRQVVLPVTLHEAATDGQHGERGLLVLDEGAAPAIGADVLRRALTNSDATISVVVRKGLGAFVALEIDVGRDGPEAHASES